MKANDDNYCFVCGRDNPVGMKLDFHWEDDRLVTTFVPARVYQGYSGVVHGGITAAVLDEIMGKGLVEKGLTAVTAELTVRYKRPLPIGEAVRFAGWIKERKGKLCLMEASAEDEAGQVLARAEAKMIVLKEETVDE